MSAHKLIILYVSMKRCVLYTTSGSNLGYIYSVGEWGCQPTILPKFPKSRKIWNNLVGVGGGGDGLPKSASFASVSSLTDITPFILPLLISRSLIEINKKITFIFYSALILISAVRWLMTKWSLKEFDFDTYKNTCPFACRKWENMTLLFKRKKNTPLM